MTSTPPGGGPRRRPVLIPVLAVLAAATVGVSAAFGGLKDAPGEQPEQLGKGAEYDQGQISTRFEDAVVRPGGKDGLGISDKRYLQIILKVTNESDRTIEAQHMDDALPTVRADAKTIKPSGIPGDDPYIVTISGGHTYQQLHPGMPTTVVMSFELRPGQPAPKNLQIDLAAFEWHEDFFSHTHNWQRLNVQEPATGTKKTRPILPTATVAAQVNLPVRVEAS
jgi:hypothetical protein